MKRFVKKSATLITVIWLTSSAGLGAASSAAQDVETLVGAKNLNALVRVFQDAVHTGADDTRAQLCTAILSHVESQTLPNAFRAELLTLIVRYGGAESVDALSSLLDHKDPVLRSRAVLGLQQNPSESAVLVLRKALAGASDPERQAIFIHALSERGESVCLPQFVTLAASTNTQVRNLALRAVALTSDTPRKALFQTGIQQGASKPANMGAIDAYLAHADRLAEIGHKRDAVSIYRELVTLGGYQKRNALMGLARVDGAEQLLFIQQNLEGKNKQDLAVLKRVFSPMFGENADIASVYGGISATEPTLKAGLLSVLGTYADPATLDTVLTAVDDPNNLVREAALSALGHFDHARATDALLATVVSEHNLDVAVQSIQKNPGRRKLAGPLTKALPASSGPVRLSLIRLLGNCPKAECVPVLLGILDDADADVRAAVLDTLTQVSDPSSFGPVVDFLANEPNRKVRFKALALLSALVDISGASAEGSARVVGHLKKGAVPGRVELMSVLPRVSVAASRESEMKILGEALESDDKDIRRAAIRAMQEWPDPDGVLDVLLRTAAKGPESVDGILALRAYTTQLQRLAEQRFAAASKVGTSGSDAYLDGGNINLTANGGGGAVTVSMWVRPVALSGDDRLFGQLSGAATQQGSMRVVGDGRLEVWNAAAWPQVAPAGTLTVDTRSHLAFVWTGNSVQAYANGQAQSSATANFEFGGANGHFGIGAPFLGQYGNSFVDSIDDVAIFSVALNAGQVKTLAEGRPITDPAPVHHWRLSALDADPTYQDAKQDLVRRYAKGLDVALTRPEKSGLLSGLGKQGHLDALKTTLVYFDDADVKEEAMLAALTISVALGRSESETVHPALQKIIANTSNAKLKADAEHLLRSLSSGSAASGDTAPVKRSATSSASVRSGVARDFFPYVPSISDTSKRSLDEQAALFKELGYSGSGELAQELGFPGFGYPKGTTIAERAASLNKYGLRLNLVTGAINLQQQNSVNLETIKKAMPILAKNKTLLAFVLNGSRSAKLDAKAVSVLKQLADIAKPHGVEIAIYPHVGNYAQTVDEALRVVKQVNRPEQVGVIFNQQHWMLVDRKSDLKKLFKRAKPYLKLVNIHGSTSTTVAILPFDQGDFDLNQIMSAMDEVDYRGPVSVFCYSIKGDARNHLTASMAKWKALTAPSDAADRATATQAPKGATVLFDGSDTSAWMQHSGMRMPTDAEIKNAKPCHYKIIDGALEVNDPGHLVTKQRFNDFRFHAEVWLPAENGMNSGIWTHFRYCNEIRGRGQKDGKYRLGAIYGLKPPDVDASKPAKSWQTLDITFRNARFDKAGKKTEKARMTVLLNGKKIHDEFELPSICPTLVEPEGATPGPIVLENHSAAGRVRFRNIWVVPM